MSEYTSPSHHCSPVAMLLSQFLVPSGSQPEAPDVAWVDWLASWQAVGLVESPADVHAVLESDVAALQ